jgi:hypothetical protein
MTIKQLHKRLDRLSPARVESEGPDLTLATQWDNSAAVRLSELCEKTEALTEEEHQERAHLKACQDAFLYDPEQVERERIEREVYGWTTDDAKRNLELLLGSFRDGGLTPDERSEFEALEARMPPREPDKSILAFERALSEAKGWRKNRP